MRVETRNTHEGRNTITCWTYGSAGEADSIRRRRSSRLLLQSRPARAPRHTRCLVRRIRERLRSTSRARPVTRQRVVCQHNRPGPTRHVDCCAAELVRERLKGSPKRAVRAATVARRRPVLRHILAGIARRPIRARRLIRRAREGLRSTRRAHAVRRVRPARGHERSCAARLPGDTRSRVDLGGEGPAGAGRAQPVGRGRDCAVDVCADGARRQGNTVCSVYRVLPRRVLPSMIVA